ncbi:MAG: deoxyguanosinetriphosphate triphosphohydrolase [Gemmataceae bacterium]
MADHYDVALPPVAKPADWESWEETYLAPYAMKTRLSRGRLHNEPAHPYRTLYQRDRDRIVHSASFRRLMYKTQVLVTHYGDHHRTRLTHTLEVAQISRTIARCLRLNEDLTEAIALLHDLGHPPFGHAGEEALNECLREHGGFEHNRQGLRLVQILEERYPGFDGLNLSVEVLESLAYHSKDRAAPDVAPLLSTPQPTLEAQVVDAADSLAYDAHDVDDALSVALIAPAHLQEVSVCRQAARVIEERYGQLPAKLWQPTLVRTLIDWQVSDLLASSKRRLDEAGIHTVEEARAYPEPLIGFSDRWCAWRRELESFLQERVYRHYRVMRMATKARRFLRALYEAFTSSPTLLPPKYQRRCESDGVPRAVGDYLAGMTDRYALEEYRRLFEPFGEREGRQST